MPQAGLTQHRIFDYIFFGYFLLQIPSTLLMDTQGVYSEWFYPSWVKAVYHHYLETYRDPFLANAWNHPWYLSVCLIEHYIGMPFFFWATYCYYYGALVKPKILIPTIVYSVHTLTAVIAIWFSAILGDFSHIKEMTPRTTGERFVLCTAYLPFFTIPALNLMDSVRLTLKQKTD